MHLGWEIDLEYQATNNFSFGASATFLEAELKNNGTDAIKGNRPALVPEQNLILWTDYQVTDVPGLTLSLDTQVRGKVWLDNENRVSIDEYYIFNGGATYRFEKSNGKEWVARLNLNNLLDEKYKLSGSYSTGSGFAGGQALFGEPFNVVISLEMNF